MALHSLVYYGIVENASVSSMQVHFCSVVHDSIQIHYIYGTVGLFYEQVLYIQALPDSCVPNYTYKSGDYWCLFRTTAASAGRRLPESSSFFPAAYLVALDEWTRKKRVDHKGS